MNPGLSRLASAALFAATDDARRTRAGPGPQAEHPRHLGRRHRRLQHQRVQPRHDGLPDAEHRQHRQRRRDVHRLVRPAELHRRSRRVRHRPVADPHGPDEGRPAGRAGGHEGGRPDDRHAAQGAGLRHRPVRQEPPRRPRRDAADRARLRRVLRQPLSPERRGRAGEPRLLQGPGIQEEVRPARRDPQLRRRPHHRHRPTYEEAHGDDRRGSHRQGARLHGARREGRTSRSSCGGTPPACTSSRT